MPSSAGLLSVFQLLLATWENPLAFTGCLQPGPPSGGVRKLKDRSGSVHQAPGDSIKGSLCEER